MLPSDSRWAAFGSEIVILFQFEPLALGSICGDIHLQGSQPMIVSSQYGSSIGVLSKLSVHVSYNIQQPEACP